VSKLDDAKGRQTALLCLIAELREHLALMLSSYEDLAAHGHGIPGEHHDGYLAALDLLQRTADMERACEVALIEQHVLREPVSKLLGLRMRVRREMRTVYVAEIFSNVETGRNAAPVVVERRTKLTQFGAWKWCACKLLVRARHQAFRHFDTRADAADHPLFADDIGKRVHRLAHGLMRRAARRGES
jgi:hypothetical protein